MTSVPGWSWEACGGSLDGRMVVDLGCLEGGFTLAFAQGGSTRALGIEARELSVQRCEVARTLLGVDNAEFVVVDIKDELARHDPFDVVFAAGILYHVADPAGFLCTIRSVCGQVAHVDTHIARLDEATHDCSPVVSKDVHGSTYRGRMFQEYSPGVIDDAREAMAWAAYSDADSFPSRRSTLRRTGTCRVGRRHAQSGDVPRLCVRTLLGARRHLGHALITSKPRPIATPMCVGSNVTK